jgi:hypothetical protein
MNSIKRIAPGICLFLLTFTPALAQAAWVTCTGAGDCTWAQLASTLECILSFIVYTLAVPLGTIAIIVGAILWLVSAGNPKMVAAGKSIVFSALVGLVLALSAEGIINFVLTTIGSSSNVTVSQGACGGSSGNPYSTGSSAP